LKKKMVKSNKFVKFELKLERFTCDQGAKVLPGMINRAQHGYHRTKAQLAVCDRAFRPVDLDDGVNWAALVSISMALWGSP
jgi:hypothetical protein